MSCALTYSRPTWLAVGLGIGLVGGLICGGLWPDTPLHAVSTDRSETFAMATGPVDEDVEAVFFLDFLTGDLRAVVLGKQGNGFTNFYHFNVLQTFGVDPSKNPRFMMVTGMANLRRGPVRVQPSMAVVYVAEITTGQVAAYAIPWSRSAHAAGGIVRQPLVPLAATRFRTVAAVGAPPPAP
jgi:hypothetical protein